MNSDLIVMTFPVVDGGHRAWGATEILRDRQTLGLEYAALVEAALRALLAAEVEEAEATPSS